MTKPRLTIESPDSEQPDEHPQAIASIYTAQCSSVSGRSTLTFSIGRHEKDCSLHLAITGNSGSGKWCKDWAAAKAIEGVVLGQGELTAHSFQALHPGRSINTGGFYLAALKDLGLIRANAENTRLHEHITSVTFEAVVAEHLRKLDGTAAALTLGKSGRRKTKEV